MANRSVAGKRSWTEDGLTHPSSRIIEKQTDRNFFRELGIMSLAGRRGVEWSETPHALSEFATT
jgi:hypothetical protein